VKKLSKKIATRCSSLPLLFSCRNAVANPDRLTQVRVENPSTILGKEIHAAIQHTIETGEIDLRRIEARLPDEVDRAKMLFHNGLAIVSKFLKAYPGAKCEQEISFETENFSVTGHVDLLDIGPAGAALVDFKTGRTRDDHYHQLVGYAVGAWTKAGRPTIFRVNVAYVYLESNEITGFVLSADDLKAWLKELDGLEVGYQVNRRCVYCPLQSACPTFKAYVSGAVELLTGVRKAPSIRFAGLPARTRTQLATAMKMVTTAVSRIRGVIKDEALKANKNLPIGNGNEFTINLRKNRILLPVKALPVLAKYVTSQYILRATRLSLPELINAACKRVKGPQRALIRKEVEARLQRAGAIVTTETPFLETVHEGRPT